MHQRCCKWELWVTCTHVNTIFIAFLCVQWWLTSTCSQSSTKKLCMATTADTFQQRQSTIFESAYGALQTALSAEHTSMLQSQQWWPYHCVMQDIQASCRLVLGPALIYPASQLGFAGCHTTVTSGLHCGPHFSHLFQWVFGASVLRHFWDLDPKPICWDAWTCVPWCLLVSGKAISFIRLTE